MSHTCPGGDGGPRTDEHAWGQSRVREEMVQGGSWRSYSRGNTWWRGRELGLGATLEEWAGGCFQTDGGDPGLKMRTKGVFGLG